jgi:PAS domain S-box-containing protein
VGLAISIVLLAVIIAQSFRQLGRLGEAAHDVERGSALIAHVERLLSYVKDAETGQRGYLLTGEEGYLVPYRLARTRVRDEEWVLRELTSDLPEQRRRLASMERLIASKLADLRRTIGVRRRQGLEAALRLVRKDHGKRLMTSIRTLSGRMVEVQASLLEERQQARAAASWMSARSVGLASALAFALLATATFALQRNARKRDRTMDDLRTARAEAEAAAREKARSLALLQTLMASAPVGMAFTDSEFRFVHVNDAIAAINGIPAKEHIGRTVAQVVPQFWPTLEPRYRRILESGEPVVGVEVSGVSAAAPGDPRHWLVSYYPVGAERGPTLGVGTVVADITDRKRAEEERGAATARLQAAHEIAAAAISHLELDDVLRVLIGRLTAALHTDTAHVLLLTEDGLALRVRASHGIEEEIRQDLRIPVGRGFAGRIAATRTPLIVDDIATGEIVSDVLRRRVRSVMGAPLAADGKLVGVIHVGSVRPRAFSAEDLQLLELVAARVAAVIEHARLYEAERLARAEAEAANRAKDDFLGTLSHELRSPLSAIRTWAHLLRRGKLDEAKTARALATIEESAKAQAQLIEDLLDVSRIIAGNLRVDPRPVELTETVYAALDTVRLAADAKEIEIEVLLQPPPGMVSGDPGRLQQVIWNLLSNAVKFTPRGGRVAVHLERDGTEAVVRVVDSGQGIRPDFLPFLFERFRQADSSSTRAHGGLGLGLAIVRHIVELHGGRVEAQSAGDGLGSTFTVRLPLMAEWTPLATDSASEVPAAGSLELRGVHLLVVDDERSSLEALAAVLEESGARVTLAGSTAEALAAFASTPPALVVGDIAMPGEDGYSLIRRIRALEGRGGRRTPALALTAYAGVEDRQRALAAGYDVHLPKPVDPAQLVAALVELAGRAPRDAQALA